MFIYEIENNYVYYFSLNIFIIFNALFNNVVNNNNKLLMYVLLFLKHQRNK